MLASDPGEPPQVHDRRWGDEEWQVMVGWPAWRQDVAVGKQRRPVICGLVGPGDDQFSLRSHCQRGDRETPEVRLMLGLELSLTHRTVAAPWGPEVGPSLLSVLFFPHDCLDLAGLGLRHPVTVERPWAHTMPPLWAASSDGAIG
ncbi:hypothetical protein NDU88_004648 [Pleurodeles waltl]|uniref:Uncharacterized protein n=1 Tax=Pleurodeles waltl TaxID=8319 RepID=A0AAV7TTA8_PLEWA|nr:hypothetical protein NDU88_004648 [Pleurodeles waltl]